MSLLNRVIQEAIDVPMMDAKNISKIIEAYYAFNFINFDDYDFLQETKDCDEFAFDKIFLSKKEPSNDIDFYFIEKYSFNDKMRFVNGNVFRSINNPDGSIRYEEWEYVSKNPEKIFFKEEGSDKFGKYYTIYNIKRTFKNKECFIKYYKRHIETTQKLIEKDMFLGEEILYEFNEIALYDNLDENIKTLFD
jgi:hypothetical protein